MARRVKRLTMYRADRPPFADKASILRKLRQKDLVSVSRDKTISAFAGAAAEDLEDEERAVIYRLLGYEVPDGATPLIIKRNGLLGGGPAVAGTRIAVWHVAGALWNGGSRRDVRMQTGLSDMQIDQAMAYAEAHREEIERQIFDNDRLASMARPATK
jgi:uncharacterized protein (DUF433 family)